MLFTFCHSSGKYHLLSYYSHTLICGLGLSMGCASTLCMPLSVVCPTLPSEMVSVMGLSLC